MPIYRVRSINRAGTLSICLVDADHANEAANRGTPTGNDVESVQRLDDSALWGWSIAVPIVGLIAGAIRLANGEPASGCLMSSVFGFAIWGVAAWLVVMRVAL